MATDRESTPDHLDQAIDRAFESLTPGRQAEFARQLHTEFLLLYQGLASAVADLGRIAEVLGPDLDVAQIIHYVGKAMGFGAAVADTLAMKVDDAEATMRSEVAS